MKPPEDCASIEDVRGAIDGLNREVLRLLGRRARYVAARFKDLNPDFVEELYGRIVSHFVGRGMEHWRKGQA